MAIEPLGSIMTMQAGTQLQKPVQVKTAEAVERTNENIQPAAKVDPQMQVVDSVRNKENGGSGENTGMNANSKDQQNKNDQVKKAVESLNKRLSNSEAIFGIHEDTNRLTIKIVDRETKEVIKELPPEKSLDMLAKVWELAGILVDEKR